MSAEVVDLATRAAKLQVAMQRHPAAGGFVIDGLPHITDPAAALTQIARGWERMHRDLTAGPGALPEDVGYEVLQVMLSALVHRTARASLVFTWPLVLSAVGRVDQVRDGDLEPLDTGCLSHTEALAKAEAELDWALYPLIHGLPARDACPDCVRTCPTVNAWQTRLGCTNHQRGL